MIKCKVEENLITEGHVSSRPIRLKLVLCHTDFSLYWLPRIHALKEFCDARNMELQVIEIAGKGSPYIFARQNMQHNQFFSWLCLYPDQYIERLKPEVVSRRLFKELDRLNPDVIVAGAIAYSSGATAVHWARRRKRAVVIMDDARLKDVPRSRLVNWVKRRIYANVDAILIPAQSHIADYEFWGIDIDRMFFGIDVVDNDFFSNNSAIAKCSPESIRQKYALPEKYVLGVGRQIAMKNWGFLIRAFAAIDAEKRVEWGLVLVGSGPEAENLKHLAASFDVNVIFLPFQSQRALCDIYSLANCLVLPSFGETWGLVINEAMACGLPVMVSKECGCAETLVQDGYNGWAFDPQKPSDLTALLNQFIDIPKKDKIQMGMRSRKIIADWGIERFCKGAWAAVQACTGVNRSFDSLVDRVILLLWKGRYRPT